MSIFHVQSVFNVEFIIHMPMYPAGALIEFGRNVVEKSENFKIALSARLRLVLWAILKFSDFSTTFLPNS